MVADCIAAFSDRVSSLQYMLTGGDRLGAVDASGLQGVHTVVNNYGPTENTVVATRYRMMGQDKGKTPPSRPADRQYTEYILLARRDSCARWEWKERCA